jgi:hypothetical protein
MITILIGVLFLAAACVLLAGMWWLAVCDLRAEQARLRIARRIIARLRADYAALEQDYANLQYAAIWDQQCPTSPDGAYVDREALAAEISDYLAEQGGRS